MTRQFILVKPNHRFAGFARTEWQIYCYMPATYAPEQVRYGFNSQMIFSGSEEECLAVLQGRDYRRNEYRTGRKICYGHYTRAGVFTVAKIKGAK